MIRIDMRKLSMMLLIAALVSVGVPGWAYETIPGIPNTTEALGVPLCELVDDHWFDDAVFIGDSISLKLAKYVTNRRKTEPGYLGTAQFLTSGSLGSGNALWKVSKESVHPTYKGVQMRIEDAVAACGAKKVYIMLGMNDLNVYRLEGSVRNMIELIGLILEKTPDAQIFVQSMTPRVAGYEGYSLNNAALFEYDLKLYAVCLDRGWHFVDVAYVMRDARGNLYDAYCSDPKSMGMHFTDAGCEVWVDYLRTHAPVELTDENSLPLWA